MFDETDVDTIPDQPRHCHDADSGNHVRLLGYINFTQSKGAKMMICRGAPV